jgi:integrase
METDVSRGDYIDPTAGRVRFDEIGRRWLSSWLVDPASAIQYESKWRLHVEPTFGRRQVKSIRPSEIAAWLTQLDQSFGSSTATVLRIVDAHPDAFQPIAVIAAGCGLRQAEIFGLAFEDFDFEERVINVRRQVKKLGKDFVFALPKNDKERKVPLPGWGVRTLQSHVVTNKPRLYTLPWEKPGGRAETVNLLFRWTDDKHTPA